MVSNTRSLIPQTVVAVRDSPDSEWRMLGLRRTLQELPQKLTDVISRGAEVRFVGTSSVTPDRWDQYVIDKALSRGWRQAREGDAWYPIDKPLPPLPGEPACVAVLLALRSILFGCIIVEVTAGEQRVQLGFDDMHDSPVLLVRFIQVLSSGGQPHAALADNSCSNVRVENGPAAHLCRLYVRSFFQDQERVLDVVTDRSKLVAEFRRLACEIGEHPNFAHHFLYHCCLDTAAYDKVDDAAEQEWDEGVQRGALVDDYDAKDEFIASRLVAIVPLPPECVEEAEQYRRMMRSLEIPREWQIRFGLRSLSGPRDIATVIDWYSAIGWR